MVRWIVATCAVMLGGCGSGPIETLAPKDAAFEVSCSDGCGHDGRAPTVAIDVRFGTRYVRNFSVCCSERAALIQQLRRVRDEACVGKDVPAVVIGSLTVGATRSELSGRTAATLDQGHGYVAFQCDGWLPRLLTDLETATCCSSAPEAAPTMAPAAAPSAPSPSTTER